MKRALRASHLPGGCSCRRLRRQKSKTADEGSEPDWRFGSYNIWQDLLHGHDGKK